jgi:hypothetical protein
MDEDDEATPPRPGKPSQIPSWVVLGFALGALFVAALPRRPEPPPPAAPEPAIRPAPPPPVTTIEAVFASWEQYAVWADNTTQVALWDAHTKSYSECYEVLRVGENYYFRSIPALTRPVLTHGVVPESPLQFTESPAQRAKFLSDVRQENWNAFTAGAREALGPSEVAKPDKPK